MLAAHDGRVSLRRATPADAQDCATLHAQLFEPAWDRASFASMLSHPAALGFVAHRLAQAQSVGFILGQVAADEAEVLTLAINTEARRQGIATRLLDALAEAAGAAGACVLHLEVAVDNAAALALYRKLRFVERGRREGYYVGAGAGPVDAVTFARAL
ncbi:MAG TPA: GNAT family N-acetyltransferase [Hyphomicrobiaceae bacterium]|jgi:ribosomal-protein-alanine N-acetyltransferase|nr:GNAT family N-acetyltransferase [Hyphomicrobiaceae bacterium]